MCRKIHLLIPNRIWQSRKIIWTRETFYVSRGETLVDTIPLNEILDVTEMNEESVSPKNLAAGSTRTLRSHTSASIFSERILLDKSDSKDSMDRDSRKGAKGHRSGMLQIKTVPDGFNFGRSYYFKVSADCSSREIVGNLSRSAKSARKRSENKSRFKRSQDYVRSYQESFLFQIFVALLILLVSSPPPLPSPHAAGASSPPRHHSRRRL